MIYIKNNIKITYVSQKKKTKKKNDANLPISPLSSPGGTGISGSLEKSIPA
jgi:hypothetical protein